jgi:Ca-activated chloride channel family protein
MQPTDFHFLRPLWFLALVPAGLLALALWRARLSGSGWERAVNPALLPHLLAYPGGARQRWPLWLLLAGWLVAVVSLAGPVWQQLPQAVRHKEDGLVIIQDLSLSFYAQDLSPDRVTRARHKLLDILNSRKEGLTALVVYAGDAHVVCPLTEDTATIAAMVPDLEPGIMPSYGSNLPAAVALALRLFRDSSLSRGRLLLLTDEVEPGAATAVGKLLRGQDITLSVLGVGTAAGGPIPKGSSGFLQDERGNIVIPRLDSGALAKLAADNGGRYSEIRIDDDDFTYLLGGGPLLPREEEYRQVARRFDQWREEGYWLLWLILPLGLLAFRRGWLLTAVLLAILLPARPSPALEWRDLWLRPDQQGSRALAAGDPARAAGLFHDPAWKGAAQYRAGNYGGAVESFAQGNSGEQAYNRGNALARLGKLEEALHAYDQALKADPNLDDSRVNRQLVEKLLRQQQQPKPDKDQAKTGPGQSGQGGQTGDGRKRQQPDHGQGQNSQAAGNNQSGQGAGQEKKGQAGAADQAGQGGRQGGDRAGQGLPGDNAATRNGAEQGRAGDDRSGEGQRKLPGQTGRPASEGGKRGKGSEAAADTSMRTEQQQELEQRLRQVADNPGGLLRRKFEYQYRNSRQDEAPDNRKIW